MAFSLADLIPLALLARPGGAPTFGSWLPKAPTNVTPGSTPAPQIPQTDWAGMMNAFTNMANAEPTRDLHKAQAEQARALAAALKDAGGPAPPMFLDEAGQGQPAFGAFAAPPPSAQPAARATFDVANARPSVSPRDMGGGMRSAMRPLDQIAQIAPFPTIADPKADPIIPLNARVPLPSAPEMTFANGGPEAVSGAPGFPGATATPLGSFPTGRLEGNRWVSTGSTGQIPPPRAMSPAAAPLAQASSPAPAWGSLAPGGAVGRKFNPEFIEWAQRQDRINSLLGKRNPVAVDEALKMAPGMSGSPEYKAQLRDAEKGVDLRYAAPLREAEKGVDLRYAGPEAQARAAGERSVTEPSDMRLKGFQSGLDTRRDEAAEAQRRITQGQAPQQIPANAQVTYPPGSAGARAYLNERLRGNALPENVVVNPDGSVIVRGSELGPIPPGHEVRRDPAGAVASMPPVPGSPADLEQKEKLRQNALREANKQISSNIVVQEADRAFKLIGDSILPTTGMAGAFLSKVHGTAAHDLSKLLDTVKSNAGLDKLQAMREASPTGGALGQVTDRENSLLQAAIGSLEQSQTQDQFKFNLGRVKDLYLDIVHGPSGPHRAAPAGAPVVGAVEQGYRFKGGNPADSKNWEKVQ